MTKARKPSIFARGRRNAVRSESTGLSSTADASWFGAFALSEGSDAPGAADTESSATGDPRLTTPGEGESRPASAVRPQAAFTRIYRMFVSARAALGLVLLGAQILGIALGSRTPVAASILSLLYAAQTALMWWLPPPPPPAERAKGMRKSGIGPLRQSDWLATIGVDLAVLSLLHAISPAGGINYPVLLALPVLMAGVMTPRLRALWVAAIVTLVLLGVAVLSGVRAVADTASLLTQAGLLGTGFFAIAVLSGELADRLVSAGQSARGNMELARQQAQLNRLVIDEMQDGVLVVDRHGRVRAANPSGRRLLAAEGMSQAAPFQLRGVPDWEPLVRSVEQAFVEGQWPAGGREVTLPLSTPLGGVALRELRLRVRFTQRRDAQAPEDLCVLFVEDMRSIYARARQDKLAAMGRMSAGIAHEIRNPLAAIAQANALMAEDASTPTQEQLTRMVTANVERLKRIVDDVLEVAPGLRPEPQLLNMADQVATICADWLLAEALPAQLREDGPECAIHVAIAEPARHLGGRFEAEHLRRVLINLLDNAWRHSSQTPAAVEVRLDTRQRRGPGRDSREYLVLSVFNDGDVIPSDVERSLFEPFFSTRSRGTGLGLYICRELCERYGASIEYRQQSPQARRRNEFAVAMPALLLPETP